MSLSDKYFDIVKEISEKYAISAIKVMKNGEMDMPYCVMQDGKKVKCYAIMQDAKDHMNKMMNK